MRRSARRGNLQAAGISSIHHVGPQLFGGATLDHGKGVRLASPEKALVDFLYLSPAAPRERMLAALTNGRREEAIRKAWDEFKSETDRLQKGIILETLVALLFRSIRGFDETMTNRRTADEEIDILIRNESTDPFWHNEGAYILGECKNWSRPIDPREIDRFRMKLQRRYGRSKLGFFIAAAGFTSGVESTLLAGREGSALVVCINRADLEELVLARDRAEKLKALHSRAVVGGED